VAINAICWVKFEQAEVEMIGKKGRFYIVDNIQYYKIT